MSTLVLELRPGEVMIVNGAPMRFRTKARVELTAKARFLFGKQIMPPSQVVSPARRIYYALQAAYIGADDERVRGLSAARELIAAFKDATTSSLAREILDRALGAAEQDDCYKALKLVRRVIRHEDAVLHRTPDPPLPTVPLSSVQALAEYCTDDTQPDDTQANHTQADHTQVNHTGAPPEPEPHARRPPDRPHYLEHAR